MTAPEKIRTNAAGNAIVTPHPVWDTDVEYIRADVAQAMLAKARVDALREAADIIGTYDENSDCPYCTDVTAINEAVTALIPTAEGEA